MEGDTPQYYVKVTGGTVNGRAADWLNPGNNTFKPNAKASYTESSWSGQTAEVVGNVRYHKEHVYTPKNKTVNITGPTTVTITASDYTETINQTGKQTYTRTSVQKNGLYTFAEGKHYHSENDHEGYYGYHCSNPNCRYHSSEQWCDRAGNLIGKVHCTYTETTQGWK